ncbi:MAG: hypothetical protein P8I93_05530 [Crocinitomicaceae bacterium]|nr:hypothetical protein [Crocinitomicaceae bacterium]
MKKIPIKIKSQEASPKCPHCDKEIDSVNRYKTGGLFSTLYLYTCIFCDKILSLDTFS